MLLAIETLPFQTFDGLLADVLFLAACVLFGGILAFMGLNHFHDLENMAGYAELKGVPVPTVSVALFAATLALLAVSTLGWPYAIGMSVF
ncbi:hypothetical protein GS429_12940 [Natronorubrum sp. JWXQ-INN-674]|uniref:Uncharacterized protein n=1 Tax=Natronorubrum halalkaliphilum TaxID=2691917 RepID=A0A6B0VNB7_9EURY|nr:hypothetical protein [Natronorubrum halalkaliphilum]MXV62958.1 hypothetical protein [Natronorubrum halalkaliphilum]